MLGNSSSIPAFPACMHKYRYSVFMHLRAECRPTVKDAKAWPNENEENKNVWLSIIL